MTRNQIYSDDEDASSSQKRSKTCAPWSDLDHDLLRLVMMKLGFGDYYSFRGVCKSWRSLALLERDTFMASSPPMSISISKSACYLEDFEGRKFRTILPNSAVAASCLGITCGYMIFFIKKTRCFWLVNPITRNELHFPDYPVDCDPLLERWRGILVFSPSVSGLVFVVAVYSGEMRFSVAGKGAWNHVSYAQGTIVADVYAFKGKIYTLIYDYRVSFFGQCYLCELRLNPEPKLTLLETKKPLPSFCIYRNTLVCSSENLYVARLNELLELDFGQTKWELLCEKTMGEYAFFVSNSNHAAVAVKRESWANPQSHEKYEKYADTLGGKINFFIAKMWYFPHQCVDVDRIDE